MTGKTLWLYHATDGAELFKDQSDEDLAALHDAGWRDHPDTAAALLEEMATAEAEKPKRTRKAAESAA